MTQVLMKVESFYSKTNINKILSFQQRNNKYIIEVLFLEKNFSKKIQFSLSVTQIIMFYT